VVGTWDSPGARRG